MKILFVILDGLADRPIKALGNKTPLEAASTPNLDFLASKGICGLAVPDYKEKFPTSIEGHLSLFGYDIEKYDTARGPFEAIGAGMKMKRGDVALRVNFATVDKNMKVIDRRAGRIKDTSKLVKALQGITIKGVRFLLADSISHRSALVMRGKGLLDRITDGDSHKIGIKAAKIKPKRTITKLADRPVLLWQRAEFTADVLNEFLAKAHQILEKHPINKQRTKKGLLPANYLLVREAGQLKKWPSFQQKWGLSACFIAGGKLYQGIGRFLGMKEIKVKGATGRADTAIEAKLKAAKKALKQYSFCYCHIKGTDDFGHDGDFLGKKKFIEKIDRELKELLPLKNTVIVVTADHCTPCTLKEHSADPIPFLIYPHLESLSAVGSGFKQFSEKDCRRGGLGKIKSNQLLKALQKNGIF